jgi:hypothetical protein
MVNKKSKAAAAEPSTLNPNMQAEIMRMMQAQGVELDAEALRVLNQIAGREFEETYKRIAKEKTESGEGSDEKKGDENMEAESR